MSKKITIVIIEDDLNYIRFAMQEAINHIEDRFKLKTKKSKLTYPITYKFYKNYKKILKKYFKEDF